MTRSTPVPIFHCCSFRNEMPSASSGAGAWAMSWADSYTCTGGISMKCSRPSYGATIRMDHVPGLAKVISGR